jgi:hypothetical protein
MSINRFNINRNRYHMAFNASVKSRIVAEAALKRIRPQLLQDFNVRTCSISSICAPIIHSYWKLAQFFGAADPKNHD